MLAGPESAVETWSSSSSGSNKGIVVASGREEATYEDVLDAPEGTIAELIDGRLSLEPRPAPRHGTVASVLAMMLGPPFYRGVGGPGGWEITIEPEIHFGRDVLVPDLGGWQCAFGDPYEDASTAYFTAVPQWVCEVLSPLTAAKDREEKLPIYARAGVAHAWLIDPDQCSVEIYALKSAGFQLELRHVGAHALRAPPFDAASIAVKELWRR